MKQRYLYIIFIFSWGIILNSCLVTSWCQSKSDCEGNELCNDATGQCSIQCYDDRDCTDPDIGLLCYVEQNICVDCFETDDCEDWAQCVDMDCIPRIAPSFALVDRNPDSATFESVVSLDDFEGQVILVFFAGLA